ncbi:MAG: hypothetical protein KGL39_37905 [Patescibacteria group bacterium]|nr:hypothetical protein [Patescibacteria group bacterium]
MNTMSTYGNRDKYFQSQYEIVLRNALVCEKICTVDNSDLKRIQNPYGSQPTATIQAVAGTYSVSAWTVTDDALTVTDEVIYAEQVYAHEDFFAKFDIAASRLDNMMYAVAFGIDKYVLNNLTANASGSYTTPAGGFTTAANINTIMGNLLSKVAGYQDAYNGTFLVIENTDIPGFAIAGATTGFSWADAVLRNGFVNNWMGVDLYVVRTGTFVTATLGTTSVTNSGHRVFGVKGISTYASPRGLQYEEKGVSGKTGKEIAVFGLVGFKLWAQKAALVVNITLA